jgi:hypothetical protein
MLRLSIRRNAEEGRVFSQAKDTGVYLSRIQFNTSIQLQANFLEIIRSPDQKYDPAYG